MGRVGRGPARAATAARSAGCDAGGTRRRRGRACSSSSIPAAIFPLVTTEGNLFRYGLITLLYALLGLGLNVTVGFAGLLDLGYIAFFGFGAYTYGFLASGHSGRHWPAELAIPLAILVAALVGLIVGFPSRRLVGDYLAIVTLFFGQAFVVFVNNANRIDFPFIGHTDLTGGANGLDNIDPLNVFGWQVNTTKEYYWFTFGAFVLVMVLLYFISESRTGRAWKALREDPLAAEVMSMPVNRLKLLAFVFGAAMAGFAGAIYGSVQTGAFPGDFDVGLLITVYAIVILGGAGSLAGVLVGALIVNGVPELLRDPNEAEWVFYSAVVLARADEDQAVAEAGRPGRRHDRASASRCTRSPTLPRRGGRPALRTRVRSRTGSATGCCSRPMRRRSPTGPTRC